MNRRVFIVSYLVLLVVVSSGWPIAMAAAPVTQQVIQPPYLTAEQTRQYSYLLWQSPVGEGLQVQILPTLNASGRAEYSSLGKSGRHASSEVRNVPDVLHQAITELTFHAGYRAAPQAAAWRVQWILNDYQTLYAMDDRDHSASLSGAQLDRLWSEIAGDDRAARVKVTMVVYDAAGRQRLVVPVVASMWPCERSAIAFNYPPSQQQAFLNQWASTTTGQTFAAAINRTLQELNRFFLEQPLTASVLRVEQNQVYVSLGQGVVYPREILQLEYQEDPNFPAYSVSRLVVEEVFDEMAITHPLDVFAANVIPGDQVSIRKTLPQRTFKSVARSAGQCAQDERRQAD
ncbi:MAG: hypothetical protein HWE13_09765 [Gammaproteobacteria bacterium]|nr:hypothetical protein [Gammaproteobacteria bacterium]